MLITFFLSALLDFDFVTPKTQFLEEIALNFLVMINSDACRIFLPFLN